MDSAVSIASHFLPKGSVIVSEEYNNKKENLVHRSSGTNDVPADTKVVILLDEGSASASEILAGALKDHGVAKIVGTKSFGKGSVQELIDIDGGSLKMTVARWITPNGHWIMGNGIDPDIAVKQPVDAPKGSDAQKDRAIQLLTSGK